MCQARQRLTILCLHLSRRVPDKISVHLLMAVVSNGKYEVLAPHQAFYYSSKVSDSINAVTGEHSCPSEHQ